MQIIEIGEKITGYLESGPAEGAEVLTGGKVAQFGHIFVLLSVN